MALISPEIRQQLLRQMAPPKFDSTQAMLHYLSR